jgi:hypothetical protein
MIDGSTAMKGSWVDVATVVTVSHQRNQITSRRYGPFMQFNTYRVKKSINLPASGNTDIPS